RSCFWLWLLGLRCVSACVGGQLVVLPAPARKINLPKRSSGELEAVYLCILNGASGWKRWWSREPTGRYCIDGANDHDRW
ncbi:hypothetical protein V5799_024738, partial [Amblyomma americanum]